MTTLLLQDTSLSPCNWDLRNEASDESWRAVILDYMLEDKLSLISKVGTGKHSNC